MTQTFAKALLALVVVAGCTEHHVLGLNPAYDDSVYEPSDAGPSFDNGAPFVYPDDAGTTSIGCGSCSVACTTVAANFVADSVITNGHVFVGLGPDSTGASALFVMQLDGSVSYIVSDVVNDYLLDGSVAVNSNVVAYLQGGMQSAPFYTVPINGAVGPMVRAVTGGGVVLDDTSMYYVEPFSPNLRSLPLDAGPSVLITSSLPDNSNVDAVDAKYIYYDTMQTTSSRVEKSSGAAIMLAGAVTGLDSDATAREDGVATAFYSYSQEQGPFSLVAIPTDGSPVRTLINYAYPVSSFQAWPHLITTDGVRVFAVDPIVADSNAIRAVPVAGGEPETLCTAMPRVNEMHVAGGDLYLFMRDSSVLKLALH